MHIRTGACRSWRSISESKVLGGLCAYESDTVADIRRKPHRALTRYAVRLHLTYGKRDIVCRVIQRNRAIEIPLTRKDDGGNDKDDEKDDKHLDQRKAARC